MNPEHLPLLVCPKCQNALRFVDAVSAKREPVLENTLECAGCRTRYPVTGGVPRFVPRENYASGFGLEWNRHARTQYDSYCGLPVSENRFFGQTGWPRDMAKERILEVGSGSGRFTEQAAKTGATVASLDYSYAVDANYASNGSRQNVLIVQADVFAMPFRPGTFDRLFCFGMLQHTPDPAAAFAALPRMLRPGGELCADIYKATPLRTLFNTKYYVRPFTRKMQPERLYRLVCSWVDSMWPLASLIRRLPHGSGINWRLLVADYSPIGLKDQLLKEWAYLDTFDMLAPRYDLPARLETFASWGRKAGLERIEAEYCGANVNLRGARPGARA